MWLKNSKDRKCVYTSAKLPILVPYPKLKNTKNEKITLVSWFKFLYFLFIPLFVLILFFIFFSFLQNQKRTSTFICWHPSFWFFKEFLFYLILRMLFDTKIKFLPVTTFFRYRFRYTCQLWQPIFTHITFFAQSYNIVCNIILCTQVNTPLFR